MFKLIIICSVAISAANHGTMCTSRVVDRNLTQDQCKQEMIHQRANDGNNGENIYCEPMDHTIEGL